MARRISIKYPIGPFDYVAGFILLVGLGITFLRFTGGLGRVTNLSDYNPWGLWIGFDLLCGVALAAGGFVASSAVYIFGMKKYHSAVRPAILTAFLGYALVVVALNYDVGRPWRLPYPFVVQMGTTSLLFEVGACVALYLTVLFVEWTPAAFEWLGLGRIRHMVVRLTLGLTIFGVILSTLHQSSLGALFLIAPSKLHPLWYSTYLPVFFFVSAIASGLSMVIFESALAHRFHRDRMDQAHLDEKEGVALGFAKAASLTLVGYFSVKILGLAMDDNWKYLASGYGVWFLVELLGFVALPAILYAVGAREKRIELIQFTAGWTVLGIVLNRLNISLVAFNYHLPLAERYLPHWMELWISLFVVTLGVVAYKFVVLNMPVLYGHPRFAERHEAEAEAGAGHGR
ncbi:MAG: NrfD/PsrC family molybdoenzyme membrane anchor subunit [Pseudomonadota bacterium]